MMLSIMAEHCYAECRLCWLSLMVGVTNKHLMLSVIMPSVIMLSVIMVSAIMSSVIMVSVTMLSVICQRH